jgi:Zn-dependent protease
MFGSRFRIVRLAGIPVYVDLSWLIILALVTWSLNEVFAASFHNLGLPPAPEETLLLALGTALVYFLCILLHELGHALVARASGTSIRGITLFLFGGVSELEGESRSAGKEFAMAIAGPAVTAVLAAAFYILTLAGREAGWPPQALLVLQELAFINFVVLLFNLIPAFPLDGGRVLRSVLWAATGSLRRSTRWAAFVGQGFAWLFFTFAVLLFFGGYVVQGIWIGVMGLFLYAAARGSYQQTVISEALRGEPVSRFMNPSPTVVPPSLGLRHWVEDYVYRFHRKTFPVASNGHLEGVISTSALENLPRDEWDRHSVGEVMSQDLQSLSISPSADALDALGRMQHTGSSRLLVTDGDRLLGIISLKDLLRFLELKLELERPADGSPG